MSILSQARRALARWITPKDPQEARDFWAEIGRFGGGSGPSKPISDDPEPEHMEKLSASERESLDCDLWSDTQDRIWRCPGTGHYLCRECSAFEDVDVGDDGDTVAGISRQRLTGPRQPARLSWHPRSPS